MAKDKNVNYDKLSLGMKLPVKRTIEAPAETVVEAAVSNIHTPSVIAPIVQPVGLPAVVAAQKVIETPVVPEPEEVKERTLRVTLDIPQSLHAEIRTYTFKKGVTMKEYFLELAKKDIGL
jgi:hypothetical protein